MRDQVASNSIEGDAVGSRSGSPELFPASRGSDIMREALIRQLGTIDGLLANISRLVDPVALLDHAVVWSDQGAADNDSGVSFSA
jgi:hypothetical protein